MTDYDLVETHTKIIGTVTDEECLLKACTYYI